MEILTREEQEALRDFAHERMEMNAKQRYYDEEMPEVYDPQKALANDEPDDPWRHRSTGMRCDSCMWFVRKEDPDVPKDALVALSDIKGRCRSLAPESA